MRTITAAADGQCANHGKRKGDSTINQIFRQIIALALIAALLLVAGAAFAEADAQAIYDEAAAALDAEDCERAFELTAQAAELGLTDAQNRLGYMYVSGLGTEQNVEQGIE